MKKISIVLLYTLIVTTAFAGARASWNKVEMSTDELKENTIVSAQIKENTLEYLIIKFGAKEITIPIEELQKHEDPKLNTLALNYDLSGLSSVSLQFGTLSSFPYADMPYTAVFKFENEQYIETYKVIDHTKRLKVEQVDGGQ